MVFHKRGLVTMQSARIFNANCRMRYKSLQQAFSKGFAYFRLNSISNHNTNIFLGIMSFLMILTGANNLCLNKDIQEIINHNRNV
jgi:hypothetical protein